MLERLVIRDLVLVEHAELELPAGLIAVTGETGAGKSLLVQAVDLLLGGRGDQSQVREGARAATVEGLFRLEGQAALRAAGLLDGWGADYDGGMVIVRRELAANGRGRALVNQAAVTQRALRELGELLLDLHGQHEHQSLLAPEAGRTLLDRLGETEALQAAMALAWERDRAARRALDELEAMLAQADERREFLAHTVRELDDAGLAAGEDERLAADAARLAHADRLRALVAEALARLTDGEHPALDAVTAAQRALEHAATLDPTLAEATPLLDEARIAAAEAARALAAYAAALEPDPDALERIENRRALIERLKRRHRRDLDQLLAWHGELRSELAAAEDAPGARERARAAAEQARAQALLAARALSRERQALAKRWSATLTRELAPLGFPHARLDLAVASDEARLAAHGMDEVEIRFAPNPGEPARALAKIASGGELSRVMLALKAALDRRDPVDLLVFDEVDSGIGGAVAQAVGERLRGLSRHRQIVCVTHLPMIAALAQHHLRVTKHVQGGRTVARIEALDRRERVEELARMLAGDRITDTTRRQARELLAAPAAGE